MTLLGIVSASPTPPPAPGAGLFPQPFLLSLFIWTPVAVALILAFFPNPRGRYDQVIRQIAFFTNLILLGLMFIGYNQFENFLPTMQYEENVPWLPAIGVAYHLGVDGPGLLMLMLAGLAGIISVLASWGVRERVRSYFSLLLLAQASVTGAIVARDMFVFVLFWGASIVPISVAAAGTRQDVSIRLIESIQNRPNAYVRVGLG